MGDLRAACIHGRYDAHGVDQFVMSNEAEGYTCPGGRDIIIDYEAAIRAWFRAMDDQLPDREIVDNVLHAAIGDTGQYGADWRIEAEADRRADQ